MLTQSQTSLGWSVPCFKLALSLLAFPFVEGLLESFPGVSSLCLPHNIPPGYLEEGDRV